ncbi:MAG: hypothetical protein IJ876_00550 [Elusimicrobiaceae bacterium]|nr:hypothetical protein [Elusimicrobiaceae bacterium]
MKAQSLRADRPFNKALARKCLFYGLFFPFFVSALYVFLSAQVLEKFIREAKKARNGPFSLTAKFAEAILTFPIFLLLKIHMALSQVHKLA